ncbi:hypothetical protein HH308_20885 [Gordonia sp. TBRC 11910]|uniref:Uncharacterized protein n=1 Tax=Gordonia asplenii TaxID=2725283 RepID=A0A848L3P4_9ACTN|nr:hypothetical protein [Gordonia asplenii]NMO03675.1 hypothetical protein [Gordonia asplenii]
MTPVSVNGKPAIGRPVSDIPLLVSPSSDRVVAVLLMLVLVTMAVLYGPTLMQA